jgi:hypothetical protein
VEEGDMNQSTTGEVRWRGFLSGLSFVVVVGLTGVTAFVFPEPSFAGESGHSPTLTVLVYNTAQASPALLAAAESEAGRILGVAGVRAVWVDCLDQHSAADALELCHQAREPTDVVLRVLPGHIQGRFQDTLFGFVFPPALASVYYEYAGRLASTDREISIMLGCAIAHELGHLLLGPNSHSGGGIMHGEWGPKEIQLALMGRLLFASQQAKLIQVEVRRRMIAETGPFKEQHMVNRGSTGPLSLPPQSD